MIDKWISIVLVLYWVRKFRKRPGPVLLCFLPLIYCKLSLLYMSLKDVIIDGKGLHN